MLAGYLSIPNPVLRYCVLKGPTGPKTTRRNVMYHALHTKTTQAGPPERTTLSTAVESSRADYFRMQTALSPGWMNSGGKRTQQESSVQVLEGEW